MDDVMDMDGMGWMMGGMRLIWIPVLIVLALGIAALVKYLARGSDPAPPSTA